MGETSQRSDCFLSHIGNTGGSVFDFSALRVLSFGQSVDLLVDLGSVVVTQLTGSAHRVSDVGRVPRADATNSSPASVGLLLQVLHSESLDHTLGSLTSGNTNDIDVLVLCEDLVDRHLLLEEVLGPLNLLLCGASVDLNLEDVVLLLSEVQSVHVGVNDGSDDRAVFHHPLQLQLLVLGVFRQLRVVLGEGLLL